MATAAAPRVGKLAPEETALLVCDVQERFRPVITGFPAVVDTSQRMVRALRCMGEDRNPAAHWLQRGSEAPVPSTLPRFASLLALAACWHHPCLPLQLRAAAALQLPVVVTEQYPKALGNTVEELLPHIPTGSPGERGDGCMSRQRCLPGGEGCRQSPLGYHCWQRGCGC